jgi:hypothetical protein
VTHYRSHLHWTRSDSISPENPQTLNPEKNTGKSLDNNEHENGTSDTGEYPHLNGAAAAVA